MTTASSSAASARPQAVLTIGFATAVAMWSAAYLGRMPGVASVVPGAVLVPVLLLICVAGGWHVRRAAHGTPLHSAAAGLIAAAVNLLIVGSVVATLGEESVEGASGPAGPSAMLWIPGSIIATVVAAFVGGLLARPCDCAPYPASIWRARFIGVASMATLLTLIAGGIVTSAEAGLAVPDWPTSFGANMFLYPLSQMTGGIFWEHAHRLYGSLVGLTMIVMLAVVLKAGARGALRTVAIACMVLVVVQGILGGVRVNSTSTGLAIVHGILGQVFFTLVTVAWALAATPPVPSGADRTLDRKLTHALAGLTFIQMVFGALYRHMYTPETPLPWPAHVHLLLAAVVPVLASIVALRAWAKNDEGSILRRLGASLGLVIVLQVLFGTGALIALFIRPEGAGPNAMEIAFATAHQANGALFLALTVQLMYWVKRA